MRRSAALIALVLPGVAWGLNPGKSLTQYTRTVWTQEHGLPQDTIRTIAQTSDGYLWLGTDEGLARFDGYEFAVYNKDRGDLPNNSVATLAAGLAGDLWIGTANGLTHYEGKQFHTYTRQQGLPDNGITQVVQDPDGSVWMIAGTSLCQLVKGRVITYRPEQTLPVTNIRSIYLDKVHNLWIGGYGGVVRLDRGKFTPVLTGAQIDNDLALGLYADRAGTLWIAGSKGLTAMSLHGTLRRYTTRDGLPDPFVRSLLQDRDGNLWAGTNGGLARMENGRFVTPANGRGHDRDWVRYIFEDREGNLWMGLNSGLNRFRDDSFTIYSRSEGLPSDEPTSVYQDHAGQVWVGFHDAGLFRFSEKGSAGFSTMNGLPSNEIFSIRETVSGDLLISTREGLARMHNGHITSFVPDDPLGRRIVFDAMEDKRGHVWIASLNGLLKDKRQVLPGGTLLSDSFVVLAEGSSLWAGTYGDGFWQVTDEERKHFTTNEGLSSNQIRALLETSDGVLWIGTFGGGLARFRQGKFTSFTSHDGLLSDNIAHIEDDGKGWLWLSTTRGICRIAKQQLEDFANGKIKALTPTNYGVEEGLRSAQCAPGYPVGGEGLRAVDGRLWFPTSNGLAVLDPSASSHSTPAPLLHLTEFTSRGRALNLTQSTSLAPDDSTIQIRYTAIHLSAPEHVRYSYRLQGLDNNWVSANTRRTINYNSLRHGDYRFLVRAEVNGGGYTEAAYNFRVEPHFYETGWFRLVAVLAVGAMVWWMYQLRLRQVKNRFALVLEERVRLAREIHDTLAQGFVGISSQLDAVAMCMPQDQGAARQFLDLARKMARHSLTEARRSVMGLRASELDGQDLATALRLGTTQWTAGSNLQVDVEAENAALPLPHDLEQHLLRIAQEAVTNAIKHAAASRVWIELRVKAKRLSLLINDNGKGFSQTDVFSGLGGHFGLIGMRERAERLGGELHLESVVGSGTRVEVTVPLP